MCATQPYIGSRSLACASYDMVTAASQRSLAGRCVRIFEALLAPKTLWMAAKCAAPCSWEKYGANTQPLTHFLRRNLHAPQEMNGEGLKQSNLQEKSPKSFLCSSVLPPAIPTAGDLEAVKEQHLGSFHYNFDSSYVPLFCCLLAGK